MRQILQSRKRHFEELQLGMVVLEVTSFTPEVLFKLNSCMNMGNSSPNSTMKSKENATISLGTPAMLEEIQRQVDDYDSYRLYDTCKDDEFLRNEGAEEVLLATRRLSGALNDYTCVQSAALKQWIENPKDRTALHIPEAAVFNSGDNVENIANRKSAILFHF